MTPFSCTAPATLQARKPRHNTGWQSLHSKLYPVTLKPRPRISPTQNQAYSSAVKPSHVPTCVPQHLVLLPEQQRQLNKNECTIVVRTLCGDGGWQGAMTRLPLSEGPCTGFCSQAAALEGVP